MKNKRDRLFFTQLFMTIECSQSVYSIVCAACITTQLESQSRTGRSPCGFFGTKRLRNGTKNAVRGGSACMQYLHGDGFYT